jgi:hypothetical protein
MADIDPPSIFAPRFNALAVPWAATGSVASMLYGEIRTTRDIDVIILLHSQAIAALERVFPEPEFYCPPRDIVESENSREKRGHFNIIHLDSTYKADVYLSTDDPLHQWALRHRRAVDWGGERLWLVPPEYVIIYKLDFFRDGGSEKHLRDIRGMLAVTDLDRALLEKEIAARGLVEEWRRADNYPGSG